ncbi:MAG: rhodanese-like domain-containing protein [Bacteroidia bacterium]
MEALAAPEFEKASKYDSLILDSRAPLDFIKGFVPGSVYLAPNFFKYPFLKEILSDKEFDRFYLVGEGDEVEKAAWIAKQSGKQIDAYLEGGFPAWENIGEPIDVVVSIEADEIMMDMKYGKPFIADIRSEAAFNALHLEGAEHAEAETLVKNAAKLKPEHIYYIYCDDGNISLTLISLLKREGYHNFYHLQGGFKALFEAEASMVKG